MSARRSLLTLLCLGALAAQATPALASQTQKAAWKITSTSLPTNFAPGSEGTIFVVAENVGAKVTQGTITITDTVPASLEVIGNPSAGSNDFGALDPECAPPAQIITCTTDGPIRPGYQIEMKITVKAPPLAEVATNDVTIKGGGAEDAATSSALIVSSLAADFGFLPGTVGFDAPFTDPDGAATTQAGSHPYQLTVDLGFPTKTAGTQSLDSPGHPRDATVDFPPGVVINPAATPVLCTEAELIRNGACPPASQVGMASALTKPLVIQAVATPLYNMVPPPGEAAALAFEAVGVGIYIHLLGGVRSDGDYGIFGGSRDLPALGQHPVFGARVDLWGDPTDAVHDPIRGACAPPAQKAEPCPLKNAEERTGLALLTLPGSCPSDPMRFGALAHSWETPEAPIGAEYDAASLAGEPSPLQGCKGLSFEPQLKLRPTTNLTDSPSGLDAELFQPQDFATAGNPNSPSPLRDALVTLPPGFGANAAQADGLGVCSSAQIGLLSGVGKSPVRISKDPDSCPDASKLGTVEVLSPLLAQTDEDNKIVRDAQGKPVPRPLHGDLFLAKPFDNPFNSLIAIYIAVEDPRSGVIAKLAGKVEPDPLTGQLSTRFSENPQLPLEAVRLHVFSGSRAPLQTPLTCGSHASASSLTPWAAPALPDAHPTDAFELSATPTGGACPTTEAQAPNAPSFSAGTLSQQAKAFSPTVLKLARADGSQRTSRLEATLPGGLLARLIGVAQCSAAQIAAARARSNPEEGALERAAPSCPAASQIGIVNAGAGAGPSPTYIQGRAYLAGPYKGAPLSVVVITPAIAGPFDLGTVVLQSALQIDPTTGQGRVVSDPVPQILQGVPTNIRSVTAKVDRPNFTLNPTSCNPKSFLATATSTLGQAAALSAPFQVGGCEGLGFKPKLSLRLSGPTNRGAHPSLRAVLTARPGDANIARSSVALPHSEFIDQSHFRTICTRVQFAANQCPAGAIYGHISATSPLVDYPLEGPVYLRSSSHKLPDVVAVLKGPPSQPIEVDLVARVDSVNGGIRFRVETVPDAPVTKVVITAQGGRKGLFQNSTNICRGSHRATVKMDGQNGKFHDTRPLLQASCGKGKGASKGKGGAKGH